MTPMPPVSDSVDAAAKVGVVATVAIAVASGAKKLLTPFAIEQVRSALIPEFAKITARLTAIEENQIQTHIKINEVSDRVSRVEGALGL